MDNQRYRIVLTGELMPGHTLDNAVLGMAGIFDSTPEVLRSVFDGGVHVLNEYLNASEALHLQGQLERVGVYCKIEPMPARPVKLVLLRKQERQSMQADSPAPVARPGSPAGLMHCPSCGHEQMVADHCERCGVVFADIHQRGRSSIPAGSSEAPKAKAPQGPAANNSPQSDWQEAWGDFEEESEPDENSYLALFFGSEAQVYLKACKHYFSGTKTRFTPGWNWGAVFSPFLWAIYRKMWGWGLLIFLTDVFFPVLVITLGNQPGMSEKWLYLGYLALIGNRIFWPAILTFLYCRYARASINRLHSMAPSFASEIDIATAGGVSAGSVVVGLVLSTVTGVFLWSLVDSVYRERIPVPEQLTVEIEQPVSSKSGQAGDTGKDVTGVTGAGESKKKTENRWVVTRRKMRTLGQMLNDWVIKRGVENDLTQVSLFQLREDLSLPRRVFHDAWNMDLQYVADAEGYRLISAGPDQLFGTADDLQYRRTLSQ